jgi:hypothetical protein
MIKTPILSRYNSTEFYAFFVHTLKVLENYNDINLAQHLTPLRDMVEMLNASVRMESGNLITPKIRAAIKRRDDAFLGIRRTVKGYSTHFEVAKRQAAELLMRSFERYAKANRLPYNEAAAEIAAILRDWATPDFSAALTLLQLSEWRNELHAAQANFTALYLDRVEAEGTKTALPLHKLRPDAMRVYHDLATLLTAFAHISPLVYTPLIRELNQIIQEANRKVKSNNTRRAKGGQE